MRKAFPNFFREELYTWYNTSQNEPQHALKLNLIVDLENKIAKGTFPLPLFYRLTIAFNNSFGLQPRRPPTFWLQKLIFRHLCELQGFFCNVPCRLAAYNWKASNLPLLPDAVANILWT